MWHFAPTGGSKMSHPWTDFVRDYAETLGVAIVFGVGTSGFILWNTKDPTVKQGLSVIFAGIVVTAAATAALNGYLGWHQLLAPVIGAVSGLVAMPLMFAIMKSGKRVEEKADDITDAAIRRATGKEAGQ